jgi:capsular exopolysaccharide synthesis family protein
MGFFYQAIKKATGQAEESNPEPNVLASTAAATATATASPVERPAAEAPAASPKRQVQHFELQHPVRNLVAFLSPPVLPQNVAAMEQCRVIRSRLRDMMRTKRLKTIMFTSAAPSEGKTLTACNLAFAFSQLENTRVLLVDADMRKPSVAAFLGMNVRRGLGTYLTKNDAFEDVSWRISAKFDVVPTQELVEDAAELLHGARMQQFLAHAAAEYNVVLIDAPPLFPIVDAQVLSGIVDGAILVVRAGTTQFEMAAQASEVLKSKLLGSVLNRVDKLPHNSYYGSYGYGSYGKLPKAARAGE